MKKIKIILIIMMISFNCYAGKILEDDYEAEGVGGFILIGAIIYYIHWKDKKEFNQRQEELKQKLKFKI